MIQKLCFLCDDNLGYTAFEVIYLKIIRLISKRADSRHHFNITINIIYRLNQFPQSKNLYVIRHRRKK